MDRVSAANYATVSGRRMWQDATSTQPGTELAATWHNGVQESLIVPVEGVGLTPTDTDNTQLFQAMSRLAGAGVRTITATTALTGAAAGTILVNAAAALTITLPVAAANGGTLEGAAQVNPIVLRFIRQDTSAAVVTIVPSGSDSLMGGATYSLAVGESLDLVSDGVSSWFAFGSASGSASRKFNVAAGTSANHAVNLGQFPSSLTGNGWKKYPDPNSPTGFFIEQWGYASIATGNGDFVTFPIAFPNAILALVSSDGGAGCHVTGHLFGSGVLTGFAAYGQVSGSYTGTAYAYIAKGY